MADSPYNPPLHQLRTAAQSARNLSTTIQASAESEATLVPVGELLNVRGIPYIRVTNESGGPTIVTSTLSQVATPMTLEDGTAISIADSTNRLVDVRGVEEVAFPGGAVTVLLVN